MAARELAEIKYLDNLPIEEELLTIASDPTTALRCKASINLSINASNTIFRFNTLLRNIKRDLNHPVLADFPTFKALNLTLESYLITLLYVPTITNFTKSRITEHYSRRKITISSKKEIPSEEYCQQLMFTNNKTWGGLYGSLGYYLNLREEYEEYQTPSQLVELNTDKLLESVITQQTLKLLTTNVGDNTPDEMYKILNNLKNALKDESLGADITIYKKVVEIITGIQKVRVAYNQLRFYEIWLPAVVDWYLKAYKSEDKKVVPEIPVPGTNKRKAYDLLVEIVEICLSYSLDEDSFKGITRGLIYQTIPPVFYTVIEEINQRVKETGYEYIKEQNSNTKTEIEKFVDLLMLNIGLDNEIRSLPTGIVRTASNIILESYAPPGGYSLWAVTIAANLLNRAYILTHSTNLPNSDRPIDENSDRELLKRVMRLIYLSGACLSKTSLRHLQTIGGNLINISGIEVTDFNIKDLTT